MRRRVRKDLAEDDKVEAVAEALINGKTGDKLEREIREQMAARSEDSGSESDASSYMSRRYVPPPSPPAWCDGVAE